MYKRCISANSYCGKEWKNQAKTNWAKIKRGNNKGPGADRSYGANSGREEEWDDSEINGNEITVMFLAGAEEIQIIGTHVIPEFGAIAALILAVAIISIIAVSAKSRLSIMPRY